MMDEGLGLGAMSLTLGIDELGEMLVQAQFLGSQGRNIAEARLRTRMLLEEAWYWVQRSKEVYRCPQCGAADVANCVGNRPYRPGCGWSP